MRKKTIRACLAAVTAAFMLTAAGCSEDVTLKLTKGLGAEEVFRLEDLSCTEHEVRLFLMNQKSLCEEAYGRNIWDFPLDEGSFDDYMMGQLQKFLPQLKGMVLMAKDRGLTLSEEEKKAASDAAAGYLAGLGEAEAAYVGITQEELAALYEEYRLADLLVQDVTSSIAPEISDDEARVMEVQEIVLHKSGTDGDGNPTALSDDQIEALRDRAREAVGQAASGAEFTSLQDIYSNEPSGSIRISRQDVPAEWEQVIFDLTDGQVSGILENEDEICIVYCVNYYMKPETEANKTVIQESRRAAAFYQAYETYTEGLVIQEAAEKWAGLSFADSRVPHTDVNFYDFYEQYFETGSQGTP